jgi:3-keto-disaccharide hydrolase
MTTRIFAATLLLAAGALAADQDFNGRWDITTTGQPRPRAMWLELTGAGSPNPAGKFVSDHGGDMNKIDHIAIANGELRFSFDRPGRGGQSAPSPEYRARIVNGRLEGSVGGANFTGVRAPVIADKDDGSWKPGKPIELFNGKDLSGWKPLNPDAEMKWSVVGGILRNAPPTTDIISERKFWNFLLHVDFRIVEHSNSGIGLRGRYEIQILEDFGKPPNTHGAAALYARVLPSVNASKPAGEWQSYDIRLVGRTLTVTHNGVKVLDKVEVEGLTAIANNADESEPGPFIVQGDHSYVEIKKFTVTPLTK